MIDPEKIKNANPLISILESRGVELIPDGTERFKACCPLPDHNDATPSFTVYTNEDRFYCFGCEKGGDVINLIQEWDRLEFQEACHVLGAEEFRAPKPNVGFASHPSDFASSSQLDRQSIFTSHAWSLQEIAEATPTIIGLQQGLQLLTIFHPHSVVWTGTEYDSGREGSEKRFLTAADWMFIIKRDPAFVGPKICSSIFMPGSRNRSNDNVIARPFLVIEGDEVIGKSPETEEEKIANKEGSAAITRWMIDVLGMRLAALVDTGNKSLHSWFYRPDEDVVDELIALAPTLGLDAHVMKTPSQPVRLPGYAHEKTGNLARLLYLDANRDTTAN